VAVVHREQQNLPAAKFPLLCRAGDAHNRAGHVVLYDVFLAAFSSFLVGLWFMPCGFVVHGWSLGW
jgi:hypothetical protein